MSDWGWVLLGYGATIGTVVAYTASLVLRRRSLLTQLSTMPAEEQS